MSILSDEARFKWVRKQLYLLPRGQSILDAGAGEQRYKKYCAHLRYLSQDFGQYIDGQNRIGLHPKSWDTSKVDIISDITRIPIKNNSFDNVLCSEVLEHVLDPDLCIKELSRVLKKGGKLILTAPFCAQTHFAPYFFYTGFSIYWYRQILAKYNLKIIRLEPNGNFFDYLGQELLRFPRVARRYSYFQLAGFMLYFLVVPLVALLLLVSKLSKGSEDQLCFGWYLLVKKQN